LGGEFNLTVHVSALGGWLYEVEREHDFDGQVEDSDIKRHKLN
jgi:hypothetical protein